MNFRIETEQETDGKWIAEVSGIPGALAYGESQERAFGASQGESQTFRHLP